jgi:hypothetical protein
LNIEINFPFYSYTKGELIEFCFGKHADVDTALPLDTCHKIQEFHDDKSAHRWYVMDYTDIKKYLQKFRISLNFYIFVQNDLM